MGIGIYISLWEFPNPYPFKPTMRKGQGRRFFLFYRYGVSIGHPHIIAGPLPSLIRDQICV